MAHYAFVHEAALCALKSTSSDLLKMSPETHTDLRIWDMLFDNRIGLHTCTICTAEHKSCEYFSSSRAWLEHLTREHFKEELYKLGVERFSLRKAINGQEVWICGFPGCRSVAFEGSDTDKIANHLGVWHELSRALVKIYFSNWKHYKLDENYKIVEVKQSRALPQSGQPTAQAPSGSRGLNLQAVREDDEDDIVVIEAEGHATNNSSNQLTGGNSRQLPPDVTLEQVRMCSNKLILSNYTSAKLSLV